jgi:hypothetical protein
MAELAGPLRVMKIAIQTAKIAYPDYERESGTKWPDKHLDPAEAQLFAFAGIVTRTVFTGHYSPLRQCWI